MSQPSAETIGAAFKIYKNGGIVSNDLLMAKVAQMVDANEACDKPLEKMAFDSLSAEHKTILTRGGFVENLGVVETYRAGEKLFQRLITGTTDEEQARFLLNVGRARSRALQIAAVSRFRGRGSDFC